MLTELEVSLGDLVDAKRIQANAFVRALETDSSPAAISVVDAVFRMLPSITFRLESHMMELFDLLRSDLYIRFPFLSKDVAANHEVVLSHAIMSEAFAAVMELPSDDTYSDVCEDMSHRLRSVASAFVFRHDDDQAKIVEESALHERNVVACELRRFLQQTTLLCNYAIKMRQTLSNCYYNHVHDLKQLILADIRHKNARIASIMGDMRLTGRAVWPVPVFPPDRPLTGPVKMRSQAYLSQYLSFAQVRALIRVFQAAENPSSSPASLARITKTDFVTRVLSIATQEEFPSAWRDVNAIACLAGQLVVTCSELVCWRMMVLSLLYHQFLDFPPLEFFLEWLLNTRALSASTVGELAIKTTISWTEFERLPMWFDGQISDTVAHDARELLFSLFANLDATPIGEPTSASVLTMILSWSAYPSSKIGINSDLASLLPVFSRGLFRAFHVLVRWENPSSKTPRLKAGLVYELWRFADIPIATVDDQEQVRDWGEHDVLEFLRFCDASPYAERLEACFALEDPLQILSEASERS